MKNITMTTNAGVCVVSVRPRPAGRVLLAPIGVRGQGTTLSSVRYLGLGHIGFGAPFQGRLCRRHDPQDLRCRSLPPREATGLTQTRRLTSRPRTRHHRVRGLLVVSNKVAPPLITGTSSTDRCQTDTGTQ